MRQFYQTSCLVLAISTLSISTAWAQQHVTGKVSDAKGPLAGVTVSVIGSPTAVQTDLNGNYSIDVKKGESLRFTTIGYLTKDILVSDAKSINVSLSASDASIDEVVVTAMGIKRDQRKLGYAVSTVNAKDIIQSAPTNFASALYGKATGVSINTSPGGATSAVSIDIRGLSSISGSQQPLLVVDGAIIRNGEANQGDFWADQRIRGNGILDINPENIETINILKGAAATALYGSDAGFGVIMVTTKKGSQKKGLGVDFSATYGIETPGVLPDYQFEYGPGRTYEWNAARGADENGFVNTTHNGVNVKHPLWQSWAQFGPKMDGSDVLNFDGEIKPYNAYKDNYKNFYNTGHSAIYNLGLQNATENYNYRFSYTRNDYQGIIEGGPQHKNTFNLNSTFILSDKLSVDVAGSYINEEVTNRPYMVDRMTNNYGGFLSPAVDVNLFQNRYKTSRGYKYVNYDSNADPLEKFILPYNGADIMDYYWTQRERQYIENTDRLTGVATLNYKILSDLTFRGRMGVDYTGYSALNQEPNTVPLAIDNSGYLSNNSDTKKFVYGDLLLSYNKKVNDNLAISLQGGYQARKEEYNYTFQETQGGLTVENWFSFNASRLDPKGKAYRNTYVKDGLFGILGFDINNYLFIEASLRQERTSTLHQSNNTFYYPSASAALELSNLFKLPSFFNYSKLRTSYGQVGNPPPMYRANLVYDANRIDGNIGLSFPELYGNNQLKNEIKHEYEIGWENKFLNNRLGFDLTYYNSKIKDMINEIEVVSSSGVTKQIVNAGNMRNQGLELGINATPVRTTNFFWDTRVNFSYNVNKVLELADGADKLELSNIDNGSLRIYAERGAPAGQIYGYTLNKNNDGSLLVGNNGFYVPDFDNMVVLGNIQNKYNGGFINTFGYKAFSLNMVIDYKWGGQVFSPTLQYGRSAGLYKETLQGRDAAHGGLAYYIDGSGQKVTASGLTSGPSGQHVFHDGMIMSGKDENGNENKTIVDAASYYINSNYWGAYPGSGLVGTYEKAVFDNNYIKFREVALTFNLPKALNDKLKMQNVSLTAFGRNLFYIYKSIPHLDPEAGASTNYLRRANVGNAGIASRSYGLTLRASF